mmetsp:Transcript_32025/g.87725  ORF Transcript_32025/g.87725 Transcript_32025/m.87725 type:complete len:228 (+) Transcript_32025:105-788(+)
MGMPCGMHACLAGRKSHTSARYRAQATANARSRILQPRSTRGISNETERLCSRCSLTVRSPDSHHSSSSSSSSSLSSAPTSKSGNWLANSASAWSSSRASYFSSDSVTRNCRSRQQAPPGGCSAISPPSASDANRPLPKCTRVCTPTVLWRESSGGPSPSSAACIASTSLRAAARTDACRSRSLGSTRSSISAASRCGVSVAARRSAARRTLDDGSARSELTTLLAS